MGGWHYWLNGREFEQTLGDSEGQGSLACCSSWCRKESDTAKQLNTSKASRLWKQPLLCGHKTTKSLQLCPTLFDPMDCSPPGSSVHGILQAGILERVAMPFSRGYSRPRDQTWVSHTAGRFLTIWATMEALEDKKAFFFPPFPFLLVSSSPRTLLPPETGSSLTSQCCDLSDKMCEPFTYFFFLPQVSLGLSPPPSSPNSTFRDSLSLGKSICHTKPTKAPSLWLQGSTCLTDQRTVSKFRSNSHWVTYKLCDVNQLHHPSKFRNIFVELLWCLNQIVILIRWRWWWFSCSVVSTSLWPLGLWPARLLCPWDFPRQEYWSGLPFLFQGIFPAQGSNLSLLDCRQTPPTQLQGKPLCPSESLAKRSKEQVMAVRVVAGRRGGGELGAQWQRQQKRERRKQPRRRGGRNREEQAEAAAVKTPERGAGFGGTRSPMLPHPSPLPGAWIPGSDLLRIRHVVHSERHHSTCLRSSFLVPVLLAPGFGWVWCWLEVVGGSALSPPHHALP